MVSQEDSLTNNAQRNALKVMFCSTLLFIAQPSPLAPRPKENSCSCGSPLIKSVSAQNLPHYNLKIDEMPPANMISWLHALIIFLNTLKEVGIWEGGWPMRCGGYLCVEKQFVYQLKSKPFDMRITNILTPVMQSQAYVPLLGIQMFLLTAVDPSLLPHPHPQPHLNYFTQYSSPFASTSYQFLSAASTSDAIYPLAYSQLSIPFTCSQLSEQLYYRQHIQNDQPTPANFASSSTVPSPQPHSTLSESSIKIEESPLPLSRESSCKKKAVSKTRRGQPLDREYNPNKPERAMSRRRLHENQNRNVVPNQINQILSFIQKASKSGHLVARLLKQFPEGQSYSSHRFYLYQALLREKVSHYTNERSLRLISSLYEPECRIWPEEEQRYYNKLCRLLIRHFLLEDSIFIILTSKRMKSEKKIDHLRARRKVAAKVFQILREQ